MLALCTILSIIMALLVVCDTDDKNLLVHSYVYKYTVAITYLCAITCALFPQQKVHNAIIYTRLYR